MTRNELKMDRRIWLDWAKPALPAVVEWLFGRYAQGRLWDLSGTVVVTPGVRSRYRLLELLVARTEREALELVPPNLVSIQHLPERLYAATKQFAGAVDQQAAWAQAMHEKGPRELSPLAKKLPAADRPVEWFSWARFLQGLHAEIVGEALDFGEIAAKWEENSGDAAECRRWRVLAELQTAYLKRLDAAGLCDLQSERQRAMRENRCRVNKDIVLVGVSDASRVVRQMLLQVSSRVFALVFGDESLAEGFDGLGVLRSEFWLHRPIELRDVQIRFEDKPIDQVSAVLDTLTELNGAYSPQQITIGVPDRSFILHLRRAMDLAGIGSRDAAGKSLAESLPVRFAQAARDYLHHQRFSEFSRLVRHPDCFAWISGQIGTETWLEQLDLFQNAFIPGEFPLRDASLANQNELLRGVHRAVHDLFRPLTGAAKPLGEWAEHWIVLLLQVYGEREVDPSAPGDEVLAACRSLCQALRSLGEVPAHDELAGSASEALDAVLVQVMGESFPEAKRPDAIELVGWLDLPLDDAEVAIVTGMNEGFVPSSDNASSSLTESVRKRMDIDESARRYARDAYALSLIARSGRRATFICGRRSDVNDPQLPSRLLFATDDSTMARRTKAFFEQHPRLTTPLWLGSGQALPEKQQFAIPQPDVSKLSIASLRVTDFKQYLQCRYRFYLDRVLGLQESADNLKELPPFAFGRLLHAAVEAFGRDAIKDSSDAQQIRRFFHRFMDREIARNPHPSAAVRIQHQQIRLRLDQLADVQAQWRGEGWQIAEVETDDLSTKLIVDGKPFGLRGRIDRVDRNETTGQLAVFDYKTSDAGTPPDKAHRRRGEWIDLQLPMYRHLIATRAYFTTSPIKMGYILTPADLKKTQFALAEWTEAELAEADEVAFNVIRRVRRNEFWPPEPEPPDYGEKWATICQDEVSERWEPQEARL